ncbi:MAG: precorrin-3B synthase [Rhizobiaceae bacterium]|nr:precorrin-3B synthase [Rhizobiaceae bacterium]
MSFRRGACPALSAPMQTGDGLLVRLATAGETLSPASVRALCGAARRRGNGLVEITARGNFQIRGLTEESAAALAGDIAAMALGLRDGVPVETNPLAGLDTSATANAAPLAAALRRAIDASDLRQRLAPKVSVVVDGGGTTPLANVAADIRLDAVSAAGWQVSIGGDLQTAQRLGVCDTSAAPQLVLDLLEQVSAHGLEARGRDLDARPISSLVGERSALRPLLRKTARVGSREHPASDEPIALTDGRFALRIALPFGSIEAGELIAFLDRVGEIVELRFAPGRAAVLLCKSGTEALRLRDLADRAGLVISANDPRARIFACPGTQGCASGLIPAREIAREVAGSLPDEVASLHISGCAKGCAHPTTAALTVVGTGSGAELVENGTARQNGEHIGKGDIARRLASLMAARTPGNAQGRTARTFEQASAGD